MEKKTGYNSNYNKTGAFGWILFCIFALAPIIVLAIVYMLSLKNPNSEILPLAVQYCGGFVFIIEGIAFIVILTELKGRVKAKKQIKKEEKLLKKGNPYIYFRELPNEFGIGVTSLLFDSTLENEKDIVAVILDLCARKYLRLEKQPSGYSVRVLKGADEHLLSNEKYILDLVINNKITEINYKEWFDYCAQDGADLGLYARSNVEVEDTTDKTIKKCVVIYVAIVLISVAFKVWKNLENMDAATKGIFDFLGKAVILAVPIFFVLIIVVGIRNMIKESKQRYINNNLKKTQKGIDELHKLFSFKAFIRDFGNFVEKSAEEVVLWDRYLSYAQVFGLTDEIMKNGYNELINNASFNIDNIDNISLSQIETV